MIAKSQAARRIDETGLTPPARRGSGGLPGDMNVSVVVPVYNSESSLPLLVERLEPVLQQAADAFELVLVDDGSSDDSGRVVDELAARHSWVRGIHLMRNYGQHSALLCGIRAAQYETAVTMDDDLQNPPEEIPKLLEGLETGCDVVYGAPSQERHGLWRNLASQMTKIVLQNAMGVEVARQVSAFRAFRTQIRDAFAGYSGTFVNVDVLLTWGAKRFKAVTVRYDTRKLGRSHYTVRMLVTHAANMMTGFSTLPLQLASMTGFFFTLFGLGVLAYVLIRWLIQGSVVQGFPFLASTIAIFSGAQLFALGIIGEYLARIHFRTMDKPPYVIRTTTEGRAPSNS